MKRFDPSRPTPPPRDANLGADPAWEEIRLLLQEANRPPDTSPERLRALRERALQRYAIEHPSLWALLRERLAFLVEAVSARTAGSRFLHLAAAGATGAVVTLVVMGYTPRIVLQPDKPVTTPPAESNTVDIAAPAPGPLVSDPESYTYVPVQTPAVPVGTKSLAENSGPEGKLRTLRDTAAAVTPANSQGGSIKKTSQTSATADSGEPGSPLLDQPGAELAFASASTANTSPWYLPENVRELVTMSSMAKRSPEKEISPASSRSVEDALLEEMEKLRFKLIINGDRQYLADTNEIQSRMADILKNRQGDSAGSRQVRALDLFRQAEKEVQDKRYIEAINAYNQVAQEMGGSIWAFMAHFQIANIEFEYLDQYGSALGEYSQCLQDFPSHFIADEKLSLIHTRVDLLQQNSENNWEPLRLFTIAQKSSPFVAQQNYLELIEKYPESRLAGESARRLADLAAADLEGKYVDPDRVLQVLQKALNLNPNSSQAAAIQFAIGDLFQQRLFKPGLAISAYQRVMRMNPSTDLATEAGSRLKELNLLRFATPTP